MPPTPQPGIRVEPEALSAYHSRMTQLADELGRVGTGTLSGMDALPADCFGRIGQEVGLAAAFGQAARGQLEGVAAAASGLAGLAKAVGDALVSYEQQEDDHRAAIQQAGQQV